MESRWVYILVNCDVQAVHSTSRHGIDKARECAVLFYFWAVGTNLKWLPLIRKHKRPWRELESFIILNVHGYKEEDCHCYQVGDIIIEYARGPKVQGVTFKFNMVHWLATCLPSFYVCVLVLRNYRLGISVFKLCNKLCSCRSPAF